MKKRLLKRVGCIIGVILIWNHLPYYYSNEKSADYITKNVAPTSKCMCAWYVIKGMWHGGCPIGLAPAYAYNKILPQMGFEEVPVNNYTPQKGDISVLPRNEGSHFGHIAVYNGEKWVSDFNQLSIYPGKKYRANGNYQIFRATDGWHWKHVWTSPLDWCRWIKSTIKGQKIIKFK